MSDRDLCFTPATELQRLLAGGASKEAWAVDLADGTKLLVSEVRSNSDASIHLVDFETGETRELTPHDDDAIFFPITNPITANYRAAQVMNAVYIPAFQQFDPANVWLAAGKQGG